MTEQDFLSAAKERFGARGLREAKKYISSYVADGLKDARENDKPFIQEVLFTAWLESKARAREKFTPKKYRKETLEAHTMKVKLNDIIEAIEFTDQFTHYFLDKVTGEIVMVSEMGMTSAEQEAAYDSLDEHGFYRLPEQRELNGYGTMENFIFSLPAGEARDRLSRAIQGRGAFRRFKDEVRRLGVEEAWYSWQDNAHKRAAIEWCQENGLEWE